MRSEIESAYRILEVEPGANAAEVKNAYREMTKVWHPDRFPNDEKFQTRATRKVQEVNAAYELLLEYFKTAGTSTEKNQATQTSGNGKADTQNSKDCNLRIAFVWHYWFRWGVCIL